MTAPARTPDVVLRRAANAISAGEITWGRNWFIDPENGCSRCALGAIAYADNPDDVDGNPTYAGPAAASAMELLADYLVNELGMPAAIDDARMVDAIETVGGWNDAPERTLTDVIAALEAAADYAVRPAVAS